MRGERIVWADRLRGISMMAILFFHLEAYYRDYDGVPYSMYVENALAAFFFVSGYLSQALAARVSPTSGTS